MSPLLLACAAALAASPAPPSAGSALYDSLIEAEPVEPGLAYGVQAPEPPPVVEDVLPAVEEPTEEPAIGGLEAPSTAPLSRGPSTWWFLAAGAALVLAWALRRGAGTRLGARAPRRMTVLARTVATRGTALLLVEVEDAAGGRRRLLVGAGGGSPTLVSELGCSPAPRKAEPASVSRPRVDLPEPALDRPAARSLVEEILSERRPDDATTGIRVQVTA